MLEEGNGNPLQYSCLENPRDGGAWWAAVYGVAQSRTRLKRLSSSSSSIHMLGNYNHDSLSPVYARKGAEKATVGFRHKSHTGLLESVTCAPEY